MNPGSLGGRRCGAVQRLSVINLLAEIIKRRVPDNAHLAGMQRKTAHIDIRVEPKLVAEMTYLT